MGLAHASIVLINPEREVICPDTAYSRQQSKSMFCSYVLFLGTGDFTLLREENEPKILVHFVT